MSRARRWVLWHGNVERTRAPGPPWTLVGVVSTLLAVLGCAEREEPSAPPSALTPAALSAPPALASLEAKLVSQVVVEATGDTFVSSLTPNQNAGGDTRLSLQPVGRHRSLLFFNPTTLQQRVGSGTLVSARLELTLNSVTGLWTQAGRAIAVHRLRQASDEYQATWACALDSNVTNFQADCSGAQVWNMSTSVAAQQPWVSPATATATIRDGQSGVVSFDVTADVAAILSGAQPGQGWLLKKVDEPLLGALEFHSREGQAPPRLVLEVDGAPTGPIGSVTGSATLSANRDTYVRNLLPNQNFGTEPTLSVQAFGKHRSIVGFDAQVLGTALGGALVKARLRLPIAETSFGWGPDRAVGVHRLRHAWTELGATWSCAVDSNTSNLVANCSAATAWTQQGPAEEVAWLTPPTDTVLISNGQAGTLEFDVTRDVACFLAGHSSFDGWLVKKAMESQTGRIELRARESTQPPALFVEWTDGQGVVVSPSDCDLDTPPGCTPTAAQDTTCNGVDDDCDGAADDDFDVTESACGVGTCAAAGEVTCVAGQVVDSCVAGAPAPDDASCNGLDDDCDGLADEDYVSLTTSCGTGSCAAAGETSCVVAAELDSCQPGTPAVADVTCDGADDDCDGALDDDYAPRVTGCGIGACAAVGATSCIAGQEVDGCIAGTPGLVDASCNGVDEDCSGIADEDYVPITTSCGVGACGATGSTSCALGQVHDSCQSGTPAPADTTCDGVDDDCDGAIDENYAPRATTCGVGACVATGETRCVGGSEQNACDPGAPAASDTTCDGRDDDCNGVNDEDYVVVSTSCGVGACGAVGSTSCTAGQISDSCEPGAPASSDPSCDGVDDDCNGSADEDYVAVSTSCGVGACGAVGSTSCAAGQISDSCAPGTPAASDPTCDGADDDCDGTVDEDFVLSCVGADVQRCEGGALTTVSCTDGNACNGVETCAGAGNCQPGTPPELDDLNPCTADACDPLAGVSHTPVAAGVSCADDDVCDGEEACDGSGSCAASTPAAIDDQNPCTVDACDAVQGITHSPAANGASCSDSDVCNGQERCDGAGHCTPGQSLELDDADPCTQDVCDPLDGVSHPPSPAGTACEDGDLCNGNDTCDGSGECVASPDVPEDDGDPCTLEYCDQDIGPYVVVCTTPDEAVASSVGRDFEFFYTGPDAAQTGVGDGAIDPGLAAAVNGIVLDASGVPLPGVAIAVLRHPELGSTVSRSDGTYDFVVNGGGPVTFTYRLEGYLEVQRQVSPEWGGYARVPDVVLIGLDFEVTDIEPQSPVFQVARGSLVSDENGARRATLLFPPGTSATMMLPDGTLEALGSLHVRATEFTVGALGDEAMPGELPPTTGYTYAVELSIDEALAGGATRVDFNQPLPLYLENFLSIPVGTIVPAGYYDRSLGTWVPSANGRVIRITAIAGGSASIDADGNGTADTDAQLTALGITAAERQTLAATYAVNQQLWRTPISHFTPWDCNFPYAPPATGCAPVITCGNTLEPTAPELLADPCERTGSTIECENQVLRESIAIAGTPFSLEYSSDRVEGFHGDDILRIPVTGTMAIPGNPKRSELVIEIAGRTHTATFTTTPNQIHTFVWDGKDRYGRSLQGVQVATVRRGYVYDGVYTRPQNFAQAFAQLSGVPLTGNRTRREITLWHVTRHEVGGWSAQASSLGGWSFNEHHAYDPRRRVIMRGDGREEDPEQVTGSAIRTLAGNGTVDDGADGPRAVEAALAQPSGIAVAPDGTLYVAEVLANRIRRVSADGAIATLTGNDGNLLVNPGCEAPIPAPNQIPGWTVVSGTDWNFNTPAPAAIEGGRTFFAGVTPSAEMRQDVDVSELAATIDSGTQPFAFEGYLASFNQTPVDAGRLVVEYRDAANAVILSTFDTGQVRSPGVWQRVFDTRIAPAGTRWIRVRMFSIRFAGSNNDGYIDGLSLRAGNTPAPFATLNAPGQLAVDAQGAVLVAETARNRVRRIDPSGIITTVAGTGVIGFSGDGGPATSAQLSRPEGVAVSPDGAIYIADTGNHRVRKVSTSGVITTMTGTGSTGVSGNNGPAHAAVVGAPSGVAVVPDGSILIVQRSNHQLRIVGPDGIIRAFAGSTAGFAGDGGVATAARLSSPSSAFAGPDGQVLIADSGNQRLRLVTSDRRIVTIAGTGAAGFSGDGGPALGARLNAPGQVAISPDGALYVADTNNNRVRRIGVPLRPGFAQTDLLIAGAGGAEVYRFSAAGQHLETLHPLTGATLFSFEYDAKNRLGALIDDSGKRTTIERDAAGRPTAIVGPYGQRTEVALNTAGYLDHVTNPEDERHQLAYGSAGLLTGFTGPAGGTSVLTYDTAGRLTADRDATQQAVTLNRIDQTASWTVEHRTPLGRATRYTSQRLADGTERRTVFFPDGTQSIADRRKDGTRSTTRPDGTLVTSTETADPRWGTSAPVTSTTTRLPSGLQQVTSHSRAATLGDPSDPLSILGQVETTTINGRSYTSSYDAATRTYTSISPEGRRAFATLDEHGRTVAQQEAGLLPVEIAYDADGRVSAISQGAQVTTYDYTNGGAASGYLARITDALGVTTDMTRDAVGRPLTTSLDGAITGTSWDEHGNLATLIPPGRPAHAMHFTLLDQLESYEPPLVGSAAPTSYEYDADRNLTLESRPAGASLERLYDTAGRLTHVIAPTGTVELSYHPAGATGPGTSPGALARMVGPGDVTLAYAHDGPVVTAEISSGAVQGTVSWSHTPDFFIASESVAAASGSAVTHFGFDRDGLVTCASQSSCATVGADALRIERDAQTGRATTLTLGGLTETRQRDSRGALASQELHSNAGVLARLDYATLASPRDELGRISTKTETYLGSTRQLEYAYDARGQVTDVYVDGALSEHYEYDLNGNRVVSQTPAGSVTATYDDRDRLLTYGAYEYTYTPNGELSLETDTATGEVTRYEYDGFGNLQAVELPTGTLVEYVTDGRGRRVGKKVDGILVKQWLYKNQLEPVAELDGQGQLVSMFAYASNPHVPDYMVHAGVVYRIFSDHQGSVRAVVEAADPSNVVYSSTYSVFGEASVQSSGALALPFGFVGGLYDEDTGLVRFGARDYHPRIGRWTSTDPIRWEGGQANLYVYASNDPLNLWDPTGLSVFGDVVDGAASFGSDLGIGLTHLAAQNGLLGAELQAHANRLNSVLGYGILAGLHAAPNDTVERVHAALDEHKAFIAGRMGFGVASTVLIGRLGGSKIGMGLGAIAAYGGLLRLAMRGSSEISVQEGILGVPMPLICE